MHVQRERAALVFVHGHEGGLEGRHERQPVQRRELLRGCSEVHLPVKGALPLRRCDSLLLTNETDKDACTQERYGQRLR